MEKCIRPFRRFKLDFDEIRKMSLNERNEDGQMERGNGFEFHFIQKYARYDLMV